MSDFDDALSAGLDRAWLRRTRAGAVVERQAALREGQSVATLDDLEREQLRRAALLRTGDRGEVILGNQRDMREDEVPGALHVTVDGEDRILTLLRADGAHVARAPADPPAQTGLRAGLVHVLGLGQSWMGGTGGAPALTTTAQDRLLMFVGGIRPLDVLAAPAAYASLVPAVEAANAGDVRGETPMSGFARALAERLAADGITLAAAGANLLLSVVAPGGTSLNQFARGGRYYTDAMDQIAAGMARAAGMGTTYRLLCCPVMLGKGDYDGGEVSRHAWAAVLAHLAEDLTAAVQALLPGHPEVPLILVQSGSHGHAGRAPTVDLAIGDLDRSHPLIWYGGTLAPYARAADGVHFVGASYRRAGAVAGVIAADLVAGRTPPALLPVEWRRQGRVISVMYRPAAPLVLDMAGAGNPTDGGFALVDAAGAALGIASVTAHADRVDVVAADDLPPGWRLRYAWSGAYAGGTVSGPRGALRDSQGDAITLDPGGLAVPLHNWAGLFEIEGA